MGEPDPGSEAPTEATVEAVEGAETPPPASGDGRARDAAGRFVPKGSAEESSTAGKPPAKAGEAEEVPPPPVGDAKAPTEPAAEALVTGAVPPEAPPPDIQPFTVRFGEQDIAVPGAVVTPEGIVIPLDQQQEIQTWMGRGFKWHTERETVRRDRFEAEQLQAKWKSQTAAFGGEVDRQFQIHTEPDEQQWAEKWLAYGLEMRQAAPTLKKEMELAEREHQLDIRSRMAQPDPEEQAQRVEQLFHVTVDGHLRLLPKDLVDEDKAWIRREVLSDPQQFLYRVGQRPTPAEQAAGAQPGEVVFNFDRYDRLVQGRVQFLKALADARQQALKAVAVAKANATRSAASAPPPPPAVAPAGSAPAASEGGRKTYGSLDDIRKELGIAF